MEIETLIKTISETKTVDLLIKRLKKRIKKEKELFETDLMFNSIFLEENEIDIYLSKIISMYTIYLNAFLNSEKYEIAELLKQLFELELEKIIIIYKENYEWEEKQILIKYAIKYNKEQHNTEVDLLINLNKILEKYGK